MSIICKAEFNNEVLFITVNEAGTLEKTICQTGVYPMDLQYLSISGPLNSKDIVFLRYLSGRESKIEKLKYDEPFATTNGKLKFLDLKNATIVKGGGYYYDHIYRSGSDSWLPNDYKHQYTTIDNTFSNAMFADCDKLKELFIPINTSAFVYQQSGGSQAIIHLSPNLSSINGQIFTVHSNLCLYATSPCEIIEYYTDYSSKPQKGLSSSVNIFVPIGLINAYSVWQPATISKRTFDISYPNFESSNHEDNSACTYSKSIFIPAGAKLSFDYQVSSEEDCDFLKVAFNGKTLINKSGEQSGTYSSEFNSDMEGTLTISYIKDGFSNSGSDKAIVKDLNIQLDFSHVYNNYDLMADISKYKIFDKTECLWNSSFVVPQLDYARSFLNTNWQSLYVPFPLSITDLNNIGIEIAELNDTHAYDDDGDDIFETTTLEFHKLHTGNTKPNFPYLIKASAIGDYCISSYNTVIAYPVSTWNTCSSYFTNFSIIGTYKGVSGDDMFNNDYYALSNGRLIRVSDTSVSLNPQRWFLKVENKNGIRNQNQLAPAIRIVVDGETEDDFDTSQIESLKETSNNGDYVNLYGIKYRNTSSKPTGLYLFNKKKLFIK